VGDPQQEAWCFEYNHSVEGGGTLKKFSRKKDFCRKSAQDSLESSWKKLYEHCESSLGRRVELEKSKSRKGKKGPPGNGQHKLKSGEGSIPISNIWKDVVGHDTSKIGQKFKREERKRTDLPQKKGTKEAGLLKTLETIVADIMKKSF